MSYCGDLEGHLYKKSPALLKGWQFRRVILRDRKLKWFKCSRKERRFVLGKFKNESGILEEDLSDNEGANNQDLKIKK